MTEKPSAVSEAVIADAKKIQSLILKKGNRKEIAKNKLFLQRRSK